MQKTCVIIPSYNEEKRLDITAFGEFIEQNPYHFLFVNDGSIDATQKILLELQQKFPIKVSFIKLEQNKGKAEAVRIGFLKALEKNDYTVVGYLDADLATPLEEIPYLLSYISGNYEIVIGSRVKRLGTNIKRNLSRHYLGRIFATFTSFYLKIKVYDSQCGAKFFKTSIVRNLFTQPFSSKWLFDLEIIYRFKKNKKEEFNQYIIEIPLRAWEEKHDSKMKVIDFIRAPLDVFKIKSKN
tara:strand:+ start:8881 stop:9600 length:720 start_codon:yes stop_codon:yes gene_type:complete